MVYQKTFVEDIKPKGRRPDLTGYIGEEKVSLWINDEIREKLAKLIAII